MEAKCVKCGEVSKVKIKERQLPKGLQETFIKCPECGDEQICFVTDAKVRRLQKDMANIRKHKTLSQQRIDTVERMHDEVVERMDRLKSERIDSKRKGG